MEALGVVLVALLLAGLVSVLVVVLALWLGARTLNRRNRVSPSAPSPAPASWLGAPGAPARLHRRLRSAVAVARAASATAPSAPRLAELSADLEQQAIVLDSHLVIVARLPPKERRARIARLAQEVLKVEQVASQVSMLSAQAQAPMLAAGQPTALDDLAHQLELLEQARREVSDVESAAGVHRTSPYGAGTREVPGTS